MAPHHLASPGLTGSSSPSASRGGRRGDRPPATGGPAGGRAILHRAAELPGDCRDRPVSDRHGDVAAMAGPAGSAPGAAPPPRGPLPPTPWRGRNYGGGGHGGSPPRTGPPTASPPP